MVAGDLASILAPETPKMPNLPNVVREIRLDSPGEDEVRSGEDDGSELDARHGDARSPIVELVITIGALALWGGLIWWGRTRGLDLLAQGRKIVLPQPPLLGQSGPGLTPRLLIPIAVAVILVIVLPIAARRLSWQHLISVVVAAAVAWAVAVALVDGTGGLTRGLNWSSEYGNDVPVVADAPGEFLRTFTRDIDRYEVHVRGHPPGMVLTLAAMDRLQLQGSGWEAGLVILGGALGAAGALVAAYEVAGEAAARRAAPFLVVAPAVIWIASSADALFLGVATWSVTLLILAMRRTGRRADLLALAGGLLGGAALMFSYGLALVALVPLAVAIAWRAHRPWRALVLGAVAAGAVLAVFVPFGFWWVTGLFATKHQYDTLALDRPYSYFVLNNLAAWALVLGPAIFVALTRRNRTGMWWLIGGGLVAVLLADASGLSEGEVERIWLPFTIWVLLAGSAFGRRRWEPRFWLGVQAASTVVLVSLVTTQW